MKIDTIKALLTYGTAAALVILGSIEFGILINSGKISADAGVAVLSGAILAAISFLFNNESATRAVRSFQSGLNTPGPNDAGTTVLSDSTTVQGGDPTIVQPKNTDS